MHGYPPSIGSREMQDVLNTLLNGLKTDVGTPTWTRRRGYLHLVAHFVGDEGLSPTEEHSNKHFLAGSSWRDRTVVFIDDLYDDKVFKEV
jgi:hypothetical protein